MCWSTESGCVMPQPRRGAYKAKQSLTLPRSLALHVTSASDDLEWQGRALCAQTDPEVFFPEKGGSTAQAKAVCRGCEVTAECGEYALAHDERFGIWGGLSERDRRKVKRDNSNGNGRKAG